MGQPNTGILVEVAPGELIDKMTILEIKINNITDEAKRRNVAVELSVLQDTRARAVTKSDELARIEADLKAVNQSLWTIEDDIRDCEREKDFGETFIALARAVYKTNDRRAALKREINDLLGSRIVEEKSYKAY